MSQIFFVTLTIFYNAKQKYCWALYSTSLYHFIERCAKYKWQKVERKIPCMCCVPIQIVISWNWMKRGRSRLPIHHTLLLTYCIIASQVILCDILFFRKVSLFIVPSIFFFTVCIFLDGFATGTYNILGSNHIQILMSSHNSVKHIKFIHLRHVLQALFQITRMPLLSFK